MKFGVETPRVHAGYIRQLLNMFLKKNKCLLCIAVLLFTGIAWTVLQSVQIFKNYYFRIETPIPVLVSQCREPVNKYRIGKISKDTWTSVNTDTYMFSAYHDEAFNKTIRIIGIKPQHKVVYYCQLWYRNKSNVSNTTWSKRETRSTTQKMDLYHLSDTHVAAYVICPLPDNNHPDVISLVTKKCSVPHNWLHLNYINSQHNYKRQFTVCLSPLHDKYNNTYQLIEWLELNRIIGAQKFIFYNFESTENIGKVLQSYSVSNITTVIQWNLPTVLDIQYTGQVAALNDCLYRNKGMSEYVVNLDIDEFLIPHNHMNTWLGLLQTLPKSGVYRFQNRFFRHNWNRIKNEFEDKELAKQFHLASLLNIERESEVPNPHNRMKYIARTEVSHTMMQHCVNELSQGQSILHVKPEVGLLHHYRNEEYERDETKRVTDDTVVTKYKDVLIRNVAAVWSKLENFKTKN